MLYKVVQILSLWLKSSSVTIKIKPLSNTFLWCCLLLYIYKAVLSLCPRMKSSIVIQFIKALG